MPTHTKHQQKDQFYFITFTCHKWLPLIQITTLYDYFPNWSKQLSIRGVEVSGYVIMPNHVHLLVFVRDTCKDFNKTIGEAKRFMAYEIVKRLTKQENNTILQQLKDGVQEKEKLKGKRHQVFRLSFDAKEVSGDEQILKVLDYIHHNPVSKKWNLVEEFTSYPYSSAMNYEENKESLISVVDFRNLL